RTLGKGFARQGLALGYLSPPDVTGQLFFIRAEQKSGWRHSGNAVALCTAAMTTATLARTFFFNHCNRGGFRRRIEIRGHTWPDAWLKRGVGSGGRKTCFHRRLNDWRRLLN